MYISLFLRTDIAFYIHISGSHFNRFLISSNIQHVTRCVLHVHTCIHTRKSCINMKVEANAKSISTSIFARLLVYVVLKLDREQSNRYLVTWANILINFSRIIFRLWNNILKNFLARNIIYLSYCVICSNFYDRDFYTFIIFGNFDASILFTSLLYYSAII